MTNAPHLLEKSRDGFKYGNVTLRDHMDFDALSDVFTAQGMGGLTESANTGDRAVTREQQDEFAARSHQLAARAWKDGVFDDEVVTVQIPQRKGDPIEFRTDEGIRADTTAQSLSACDRRSPRTAPSPPARHPRSPTAPPPSSSCAGRRRRSSG